MGTLQRYGSSRGQHRVAGCGRYRTRFGTSGYFLRYVSAHLVLGWSICHLRFRLPYFLDPPAPVQQRRHHNGRAYPHLQTTQQLHHTSI